MVNTANMGLNLQRELLSSLVENGQYILRRQTLAYYTPTSREDCLIYPQYPFKWETISTHTTKKKQKQNRKKRISRINVFYRINISIV